MKTPTKTQFAPVRTATPGLTTDEALYGSGSRPVAPRPHPAVAVLPEGEKTPKVPVSNKIDPDAFLLLKQLELVGGEGIGDILSEAIRLYAAPRVAGLPPLSHAVLTKLRARYPFL